MSLTQLRTRKCGTCGNFQELSKGDECAVCGTTDQWRFFCERHDKTFAAAVCDICEQAAVQEQAARRAHEEAQERRRLETEARERRRREAEAELRKKLEEEQRREKAFTRMARIPAYVALAATLLCMLLSAQFLTHGTLLIPYSAVLIVFFLGLAIVATLSIFVVAMWFPFR